MRLHHLLLLSCTFAAAEKPSPVDGIWLGTIHAGGTALRVQVHVRSDSAGKESWSLDSLDQGAMEIPCDNVQFQGDRFSFAVPAVNGHWSGTLSENGNELDGTWTQGSDLPLKFLRQTVALTPKPQPPTKYDDALAAVPVGELKAVLDRDLAAALKDGLLAQGTGVGVVVGVTQHGTRRTLVYGPVSENSIFEIGSISKTFTGLIFARMVAENKVKLDEPVRELLPPATVAKPEGAEITLLDLATQHSGLPRMPDNFHPSNPRDPYADYHAANLYEFIAKHGVSKPAKTEFIYSNLGVGLLGQALVNRAALAYPELLKAEITGPLSMNDTVVNLSAAQEKRFAQGHSAPRQEAHAWSLDALAGAGAIRSTASDMLTYLEAQLHPNAAHPAALAAALEMSHELRADAGPNLKIGLAWLFDTATGNYWHNGATGGFSSYAFFNPKDDYAAIVLCNSTIDKTGSFADRLGEHVAERLSARPAITLHE